MAKFFDVTMKVSEKMQADQAAAGMGGGIGSM